MPLNIVYFALGLILAALTLRDVFDTVVVPGGSRASLRVAHRLGAIFLPVWKAVRGRRRGLSPTYAPFILVSCFIIWMGLLAIGFGLMAYALRSDFEPALRGFGEAVYLCGSSLVTVGLSQVNPAGGARWVILGAGFCGLAVMTMAVTYLLEVQSSIARRDTGIIKLNTSAGNPPSALAFLERFATIDNRDAFAEVLEEGRNWCATVRQSHTTHPSMIYFRSIGIGAGWPAALGALLDLALLFEMMIDERALFGRAVLLHEEGLRMAHELAGIISLKPKNRAPEERDLREAAERLVMCGYGIRGNADFAAMAQRRAGYTSCVDALAEQLGQPTSLLIRR